MNILLDTHVWVWSQEQPEAMGERSRELLLNVDNDLFVSSISVGRGDSPQRHQRCMCAMRKIIDMYIQPYI